MSIAKNVFYNVSFNYGSCDGQSKFSWGINNFDLAKPLKEQIIKLSPDIDLGLVYNFQVNAFNNIKYKD